MDDFENKNQSEEELNGEINEVEDVSAEETIENSDVDAAEVEADGEVEATEAAELTEEIAGEEETVNPEESAENAEEFALAEETPKKKSNKKTAVILAVSAVIAILIAIICVLAVKLAKGETSTSFKAKDVVMTIDDVDVTAGEFSFYYSYMYSYYYQYIMYGQATTDDIKEMAINEIAYSSAVYALAEDAGFELTDEQIETNVTDTITSYREYAEENDMTLDEFLSKYYGKGFNEKLFTEIITKNTVATLYKQNVDDELADAYLTEDGIKKVNEEYANNKKDYDTLAIKYYYFTDETDDDGNVTGTTAQENAEKLVSFVNAGQTFAGAIYNNFGDDDYSYTETECPSVDDCTYETLTSLAEEAAEWAFEQDDNGDYSRKVGDMKIVESSSMQYVIYVESAPAKNENYEVSYRDILVSFGDEEATDEVINTTKEKADEILATFNEYISANPDENAENYFSLLASSKSEDSNTASNGGLVENVTEAENEADKWALESGRKAGDTSVIKDTDGYHIVFYTNASEHPVWFNTIVDVLAAADSDTKFADCESASERAEVDDDKITAIIAYIEDAMNSSDEEEEDDEDSEDTADTEDTNNDSEATSETN